MHSILPLPSTDTSLPPVAPRSRAAANGGAAPLGNELTSFPGQLDAATARRSADVPGDRDGHRKEQAGVDVGGGRDRDEGGDHAASIAQESTVTAQDVPAGSDHRSNDDTRGGKNRTADRQGAVGASPAKDEPGVASPQRGAGTPGRAGPGAGAAGGAAPGHPMHGGAQTIETGHVGAATSITNGAVTVSLGPAPGAAAGVGSSATEQGAAPVITAATIGAASTGEAPAPGATAGAVAPQDVQTPPITPRGDQQEAALPAPIAGAGADGAGMVGRGTAEVDPSRAAPAVPVSGLDAAGGAESGHVTGTIAGADGGDAAGTRAGPGEGAVLDTGRERGTTDRTTTAATVTAADAPQSVTPHGASTATDGTVVTSTWRPGGTAQATGAAATTGTATGASAAVNEPGAATIIPAPAASGTSGDETSRDGRGETTGRDARTRQGDSNRPVQTSPAARRAADVEATLRLEQAAMRGSGTLHADAAPMTGAPVPLETAGPPSAGARLDDIVAARVERTDANQQRVERSLLVLANQRGGTMTVRLDPPELGTLRMRLSVARGVVTATIEAAPVPARVALEQHLGELRAGLESQGLTVDRLSVQSQEGADTERSTDDTRQRQHRDAQGNRHGGRGDTDNESDDEPGGDSRFMQFLADDEATPLETREQEGTRQ